MPSSKYPRTFHLPWSPGLSSDDRVHFDVEIFLRKDIVITEKLDGGNTCLTREACYSRSHGDVPKHPAFNELKSLWAQLWFKIPQGMDVFGEWLRAVHSIEYDSIEEQNRDKISPWFHVIAIRDRAVWMDWEETKKLADSFNLTCVPELWRGRVNSVSELQTITTTLASLPSVYGKTREGVVVRIETMHLADAPVMAWAAKYVRAGHVQTDEHWTKQKVRHNH